MAFIGYYDRSVALTYASIVSAVAGMTLAAHGNARHALVALVVSGACDSFDGAVARRFDRDDQQKAFGVQLDSLADAIAFLALPAMILVTVGNQHLLAMAVAAFYAVLGVVRLAWFNVTTEDSPGVFHGLPVTQVSLTIPLITLITGLFSDKAIYPVLLVLYPIIGILFVTDFTLPKPRGWWLVLFGVLFLATSVWLLIP